MKKRVSRGGTPEGSGLQRIRRALAEGWTPPVARLVGFRLTKIERGTAAIELQASRKHENPMGTLHGGIICDIADAAMGMAYASLLRADESFTTVELKINFLRPFWSGRLVARGKVIKKGRTMGLLECRVTDDERRLVAYATCTCMTLDGEKEQGLTRPRNDTVSA
jgi:uncharacterized protein (TIGR00369 family)